MNVGLPGTGIGGLFYLLSVFYMLIAEIIWTCRGKSSKKRWKTVIEQSWIGVSMIAIAFLTNYIFNIYVFKHHVTQVVYGGSAAVTTYSLIQEYPILFPIFLLLVVLLVVQGIRGLLLFRIRKEIINRPRIIRI